MNDKSILSIENVLIDILGYPLSYIEFFCTIAGITAVYLASRNKILSWPIGLFNVVTAFFIYFQVQLYADMGLQIYFFITGIIGWIFWSRQKNQQKKISRLRAKQRLVIILAILLGTMGFGYLSESLTSLMPSIFTDEAAYPYWDGLTTSMSIAGNLLLAFRKIENWILWIIVNIISVSLYSLKGIHFFAVEYFIFLLIAILGFVKWKHELNSYSS